MVIFPTVIAVAHLGDSTVASHSPGVTWWCKLPASVNKKSNGYGACGKYSRNVKLFGCHEDSKNKIFGSVKLAEVTITTASDAG